MPDNNLPLTIKDNHGNNIANNILFDFKVYFVKVISGYDKGCRLK